ncbi:hypothetical protein M413DRAFT_176376 [Hebeloma cylindrosporum]|uniref:Potassium transport protein n=1 Tax=Hebeloma cylindrosporum TaxID=76867 RepID=A0A0C2XRL1_HEBCY|nr:hypothetical protein M413DRAFT_176376 [Hebeloma cylindrosporum h7]
MTSILSRVHTTSTATPKKESAWKRLGHKLNFFRIHLLFFTFIPLIFSGIFYASNGRYKISYVDSLFNCVSAMTVTGLATINLSSLTGFQQALLFMLMCMGNPVIVSWVIVYTRRHFFAKKFQSMLEAAAAKRAASIMAEASKENRPWPHRFLAFFTGRKLSVIDEERISRDEPKPSGGAPPKLRPDMIRRMDDAPKLVNPSGLLSERQAPSSATTSVGSSHQQQKPLEDNPSDETSSGDTKPHRQRSRSIDFVTPDTRRRRLSDPGPPSRPSSPTKMYRSETIANKASPPGSPTRFHRTQTVEFAPTPKKPRGKFGPGRILEHGPLEEEEPHGILSPEHRSARTFHKTPSVAMSVRTHGTGHTHFSHHSVRPESSMTRDFGGFPSPFSIIRSLVGWMFPQVKTTLTRTMTMPATMSLTPSRAGASVVGKKQVPYISFDAVVGRNSAFHLLTSEQLDEIGGVEYRALNALLWIVAVYHIVIQLIAFTIVAPYISTNKWKPVFDEQVRPLNTVWFSAFQVVSGYTNTGTSLVDASMVPFQTAYVMIIVVCFLILAGNTSFPIFLRFMIWCLSKIVHRTSEMHETLHFLLDHPRRCYTHLFPSHQTWFLFTIVLLLTCIDWVCFLVLDIGNPEIESIPVGTRILDGLMQGIAVRGAGFAIVSLSALAPAVKVLYVVMMYISVYPVAMSVRSTNVYEEQSLGIFNEEVDEEEDFEPSGPRMTVWSRYLAMHARRQLAFDMWWLAFSLFVICIIEKNNLENPANFGWFDIFRLLFELVSAYGTVGLSLGIPDQNYSFAGSLHTLSKLIICLVMLRGRHRGLPVAIDRAVMLPTEFKQDEGDTQEETGSLPEGRPFTHSETTNSRTSRYGAEIRQRLRRMSKRTNEDDGYTDGEENGNGVKQSDSAVDENLGHGP